MSNLSHHLINWPSATNAGALQRSGLYHLSIGRPYSSSQAPSHSQSQTVKVSQEQYPRESAAGFWGKVRSYIRTVFCSDANKKRIVGSAPPMPWLYGSAIPLSRVWQDMYNPVRKGWYEAEVPLMARTFQEGKSAIFNSASHLGLIEGRLIAGGVSEIEHGLAKGACRAEPVLHQALTKAGRFLAGLSWREVLRNTDSFIQQLFLNQPPKVLQKSSSVNQYVRRIFIATALGFVGIKIMLKVYESVTPILAKKLGPKVDSLIGNNQSSGNSTDKKQSWPLPGCKPVKL